MIHRCFLVLCLLALSLSFAQSIEEKKQSLKGSGHSLHERGGQRSQLLVLQGKLQEIYDRAEQLRQRGAPSDEYQPLLLEAKRLHQEWAQIAKEPSGSSSDEQEAIWHLPDATVKQLVIDFGGAEAIYLIPDEIAQRKVAVVSSLALARENWSSMLELLLSQMGIGVRSVNPFCKELFLAERSEHFELITDSREQLWLVPDQQRVCWVVGPGSVDLKQFARTLTRLVDSSSTQIKPIGPYLALVGPALRLRQLIQIYDFMDRTEQSRAYRVVSLSRLAAEDLQRMLSVVFAQASDEGSKQSEIDAMGLQVFPIKYEQQSALFIAGAEGEVRRAVELVKELEGQIELSSGKRLFFYTARHANPEDLAKVVSKVYRLLVETGEEGQVGDSQLELQGKVSPAQGQYNIAPLIVAPTPVGSSASSSLSTGVKEEGQIVVDPKSGALIMVVEGAALAKLKELVARLDTPKQMVRLDFLLFEKRVTDQTQFGLEQLNLGRAATGLNQMGAGYSIGGVPMVSQSLLGPAGAVLSEKGIVHFFASRQRDHGVPSFDLAYNFLLSQENLQINANPSVITINGTPSLVNLVEERSINTGPTQFQTAQGQTALQNSYTRAQFGITIKVTPVIQQAERSQGKRSVTLETDIIFDTTESQYSDDKPIITRRNIKNLVRVADGQTLVLGGLRQKDSRDGQSSLPFLGEIPGFGKLFSYTSTRENTKEMFIFITPHIIDEPESERTRLKELELRRRPGESNELLAAYEQSKQQRRFKLFSKSLKAILGEAQSPPAMQREYDGR